MSLKLAPPSMLTCHCTVGTGVPLAPAVKLTLPGHTVWLAGSLVTTGALCNVNVAALLATLAPHRLLNRARYSLPQIGTASGSAEVELVAPARCLELTH